MTFAAAVIDLLREKGATLACAESCSGGLIGSILTDVPGSSDVFLLSVVAYHNDIKRDVLGVEAATLEAHGAVSEETVIEMVAGARRLSGASYAVAISGIAGPGGGTPEKPVGTIWLAASCPDWTKTHKLSLPFDRRRNKIVGAYSALDLLRRALLR